MLIYIPLKYICRAQKDHKKEKNNPIHAFVSSQLYYKGFWMDSLKQQLIKKSADWVLINTEQSQHITQVSKPSHWLPVIFFTCWKKMSAKEYKLCFSSGILWIKGPLHKSRILSSVVCSTNPQPIWSAAQNPTQNEWPWIHQTRLNLFWISLSLQLS